MRATIAALSRSCLECTNQDFGRMLYYLFVFLVVAIVAGLLGFGGIAGASAGIAQVLFFIFLGLLTGSLILNQIRH